MANAGARYVIFEKLRPFSKPVNWRQPAASTHRRTDVFDATRKLLTPKNPTRMTGRFFSVNTASVTQHSRWKSGSQCPSGIFNNNEQQQEVVTMIDHDELLLLLLVLQVLSVQLDELIENTESLLVRHIREQKRLDRSLPVQMKRSTWQLFSDNIADNHFRRMFRMTRPMFAKLCTMIKDGVGQRVFKPEEEVIKKKYNGKNPPIAGEIKVALSLRMLAGGSYLDIVVLFGIKTTHIYNIFHQFISWVLKTFRFPLVPWLREGNWNQLEQLANLFAEKSNGVFYGTFSSLDGIAIRVSSPRMSEVPGPGNYYCRKGFYALNVQAICDKRKRFLWCYPTNKGSTHDSAAFANSKLYDLLMELSNILKEKGLFIAGDTAYGLTSFLQVPFDSSELRNDVDGMRDSYNYHLSSCRIYIECAFGEMVMRWGILWRTILFSLKKSGGISTASIRQLVSMSLQYRYTSHLSPPQKLTNSWGAPSPPPVSLFHLSRALLYFGFTYSSHVAFSHSPVLFISNGHPAYVESHGYL
jgi:DDE superfamily endonuclease